MTEKSNRMYLVWSLYDAPRTTYFYCKDIATLMTTKFSEATILDSHEKIQEMAKDTRYGPFKVHQATGSEIFKWQLKNELPSERQ